MSYIDGNHPAPFGAITIYRATAAAGEWLDRLRGLVAPRAPALSAFSPAQLEDFGLSVADLPADRRPGPVARLVAAFRERSARRRTIVELSRLSNAQLDDIGLTRAHIDLLRLGHPLV